MSGEFFIIEGSHGSIRASNVLPAAVETIIEINERVAANKDFGLSDYGHALWNLGATACANEQKPVEEQKRLLREKALGLIEKHGEKIKDFLRPELKAALDLD